LRTTGTQRAFDGILAGIADQELDIPDGSFAETKRDLQLVPGHVIPPQPLKLATDVIRLPGTLTTGFLDAASGLDQRNAVMRVLNEPESARLN